MAGQDGGSDVGVQLLQEDEDRARAIRIEAKLDRVIGFCELVETLAGPWLNAGKGRLLMMLAKGKQ